MYAQNITAWGHSPEPIVKLASQVPNPTPEPATSTSIQSLICSYSWDCTTALRVAYCESTNNPRAYNAGNYGLYQINGVHITMLHGAPIEALYDPEVNIRVAYELYAAQGWAPWACK